MPRGMKSHMMSQRYRNILFHGMTQFCTRNWSSGFLLLLFLISLVLFPFGSLIATIESAFRVLRFVCKMARTLSVLLPPINDWKNTDIFAPFLCVRWGDKDIVQLISHSHSYSARFSFCFIESMILILRARTILFCIFSKFLYVFNRMWVQRKSNPDWFAANVRAFLSKVLADKITKAFV